MPASQAAQAKSKKGSKSRKKPTKKKAKRPSVKKVVVRRQVVVEPYPVYDQYNPFGIRPFVPRVVSNPQYNFYQQPPKTHVRQISAASPAAQSMSPVDLFDRVRAESAALRRYRRDAGISVDA